MIGGLAGTIIIGRGERLTQFVQAGAVITVANVAPVANAGVDQSVNTGDLVQLDGSASSDPENDPLTYAWALVTPQGSNASLSDVSIVDPTFTPDVEGSYTVILVVNDGNQNSPADSITITAAADDPPEDTPPQRIIVATENARIKGHLADVHARDDPRHGRIHEAVLEANLRHRLWTRVPPKVPRLLDRLRRTGLRLGVEDRRVQTVDAIAVEAVGELRRPRLGYREGGSGRSRATLRFPRSSREQFLLRCFH